MIWAGVVCQLCATPSLLTGMATVSYISLTYKDSISAAVRDNLAPKTTVPAPARTASTPPNPADSATNSNTQAINIPPTTPGLLRTRFIEPIVAHSQSSQQTLPPVRQIPLPVPTPVDPQPTQDSVNGRGTQIFNFLHVETNSFV